MLSFRTLNAVFNRIFLQINSFGTINNDAEIISAIMSTDKMNNDKIIDIKVAWRKMNKHQDAGAKIISSY